MKFPTVTHILGAASLLGLVASCVPAATDLPTGSSRGITHAELDSAAPMRARARLAGGYASSADSRGVPTFIWASKNSPLPPSGGTHEQAALFHAQQYAAALAVEPSSLAAAAPVFVADRGKGGVVVHLRQRFGGIEVYRRELRLLLRKDQSLVALSGGLHPTAPPVSAAFVRTPEAALAAALSHALGAAILPGAVVDQHRTEGDNSFYQLAPGDHVLPEGAMVKKVLFPEGQKLRPAFAIEFYAGRADSTESEAWRYVVAADDGHVLERVSLTQFEAYNYRVWTDTLAKDKRVADGPIEDYTPHPRGLADWTTPSFVAPTLVSMEGFNRNPSNKVDPWLPMGATETNGNNVDAYTDRKPPDGLGGMDFRASVTSPLTFDRTYDLNQPPTVSNPQAMAGITQAFYATNWLHDYWYDSGFNESAGNAQTNNFGRGGAGNDKMHVQTQDGLSSGQRDNANMSTPSDGFSPRMQIYVWSGRDNRVLHVTPPDADQPSGSAAFGPEKFSLDGVLAEADDGSFPSTTDACEPIRNDVKGKIALVDRGACTFKRKTINAQNAGAIGILIANNVDTGAPGMANGDPVSTIVSIPVMSTTKLAGTMIRSAMAAGPVSVHFARAREIDRDGSLDNTVVDHEWGHYLHHRLADCGASKQCNAMSEGWGDFDALFTLLKEGDNLDGVYALAIYASAQFDDPAYFGIRRLPYSVDFRRNGLTFKHISDGQALPTHQPHNFGGGDNSEVHNAGEVWVTMMFEAYVALQKAGVDRGFTFDQVRRTYSEYVVTSLQMSPGDATYTEARDALMAAAGASDPMDQMVIAEAFARRGAGTCADSPPRSSETFEGVVEGFKVQPRLVIDDVTLDDSPGACATSDHDGVLDSGEHGKIEVSLSNGAMFPLSGVKVELSTTNPEITFIGPTTFDIPALDPFASTKIVTEVALDPAMADPGIFTLRIQPSANAACEGTKTEARWRINYDNGPESTATETVESADAVWKLTGEFATDVWERQLFEDLNHVWHGADYAANTDTALESPPIQVSDTEFFLMRFEHRHLFDARDLTGTRNYYDGGVIEISEDDGKTWADITTAGVNPLYNGTLLETSDNALAKQRAFVDKNFAWPKFDRVTLNFLDKLAGKTVRFRFRLVTDSTMGGSGWSIDNVSFQGAVNTPFSGPVFDPGACGQGPRGPDAHPMVGGGCSISPRRPAPPILFGLLLLAALLLRRRPS